MIKGGCLINYLYSQNMLGGKNQTWQIKRLTWLKHSLSTQLLYNFFHETCKGARLEHDDQR